MNRTVIYARYSAGSGQTDQSIEGQVRECKAYIKKNKLQLVGIYADRHITGRTDQRPEFQKMISDAEAGAFDVLVVYTTDRFSRDKYDSAIYKRKLKDCGVQIRYAAENIPEGPEGILLEALMEGWAQYYSEELSRKILRGMHDTAYKKKSTGSKAPIGYRVGTDQQYEINPDVAPHVVHAFEMYLEGATFADISRYFGEHDIRTGRGNLINGNAVRKLLTSKRYIGEYKWADVVIEGGMPAIVPEDLFYMVQKKIEKNHKPHAKSAEYYLSGKLFCGCCGSNYKGVSGTSKTGEKHYYYKCTGKDCDVPNLPARDFESFIASEVADSLLDPDALDMIVQKLCEYQKKDAPAAAMEPEKKLARIEKQLDALVYNLSQRPGSDALLNKLDELEAEREELRAEIAISSGDRRPDPLQDPEALKGGIIAFLSGFSFDDTEKHTQRILDAFVRKVVKNDKKILIELNLTGVEPLELEDLFVFDQGSNWWSSLTSGRTIVCGPAVVLVSSYTKKREAAQ
ncbi:MAG: recombinase family protein [Firmicutes bacterium]|nr:recombinase family protein [Bacillota bacterium]